MRKSKRPSAFSASADHVALEGREVMRQPGHRRGEPAGQPQLARHEIDGERQHRGRQNLLPDRVEQILRRHALLHPFAQRPKEVCLLDVFFAIQRHEVPSRRLLSDKLLRST